CSYSPAENETIADWLAHNFGAQPLSVEAPASWSIVKTASSLAAAPGYRFFPHLTQGEGFFVAAFRKPETENGSTSFQPKVPAYKPQKTHLEACKPWMEMGGDCLYQHEQQLFVMPENTHRLFLALKTPLNIRKAGVKLGDLAHGQLVPDHALALSNLAAPQVDRVELSATMALQYLRKATLEGLPVQKGWQLVTYQHLPLGWIKNLGNRVNNYYPADWRIRIG
ncbi:MAG: RNA methyltransferase, partial [Bacteroidetes bacterium]